MLQVQLERTQLDKLRAERSRDGANAKLGRMMMSGVGVSTSNLPIASGLRGSVARSLVMDDDASLAGVAGFSHAHSTSAPVSPLKAVGSCSPANSSPRPGVGGTSAHSSPRVNLLSVKAAGLPARGPLSPGSHMRLGELQQKDQQYDEHITSSELL